jgi:polyphosphate kinase
VRLEVALDDDLAVVQALCAAVKIEPADVFRVAGPLNLPDFMQIVTSDERRELHDEPFTPQFQPRLQGDDSLFSVIKGGDVLLHHPYDSFETVIEFIEEAAKDPDVLAIKQTLYRTGGSDSLIVKQLQKAAENGKQVTALVELRARFDEASNIKWARQLEEAGVHVVYGMLGLKTHCKVTLVVRREAGGLRRYVHLSTGNYNMATARLYTDVSLLTADPGMGEDVGALFNYLTANSVPPAWKRLTLAPLGLRERVVALIEREAGFGNKGRIIAKLNALVDPAVIAALYRASQAGVQIDLIVRGICCLRPGIPKISERIRVTQVVDRFLEHARIAYFENGGKGEVFLSSADWMPRNFERRVEVMFPVENVQLREQLVGEILTVALTDNTKASTLNPDGTYTRIHRSGADPVRIQQRLLDLARARATGGDAALRATVPPPRPPAIAAPAAKPARALAAPPATPAVAPPVALAEAPLATPPLPPQTTLPRTA